MQKQEWGTASEPSPLEKHLAGVAFSCISQGESPCRYHRRVAATKLTTSNEMCIRDRDFIDVVRLHAEDGVDFVTLHCGITRKTIEQIRKHKRKMNIVSRGGSLVFAWMCTVSYTHLPRFGRWRQAAAPRKAWTPPPPTR